MPELAEVEAYRRLAERVVGRQVSEVVAPDAWYLKRGLTAAAARAALAGRRITSVRRTGKVLLLETDGDGPVLGLRFGMSGRL
ncbi:MAG: Fpg/Nei family DNA glycosylase, partial [Actinomycetota bacterium]|nr:Fpg/Nei family DNA glycosylase [Actinomycetota bacterium]